MNNTTTTNISVKQPDQNNISDMDRCNSKIVLASAIFLLIVVYFCSLSKHNFFNALGFEELVDADGQLISSNRNKKRRKTAGVTYYPGDLVISENGLLLSEGLTSKIIARTGRRVQYVDGGISQVNFHSLPDAGATFPTENGGWIYVSNSERSSSGGVGALTFNLNGDVIDYRMVLSSSRNNCGGGKTPWNTWISCEERIGGNIWEVDPTGQMEPRQITMGDEYPGKFESFAFDIRDTTAPKFFVTKDDTGGELTRFIPDNPNWEDTSSILTGNGKLDYLVLTPSTFNWNRGRFSWTSTRWIGSLSARWFFRECEGIAVRGNELYFITKKNKEMFILNLDTGIYQRISTYGGDFDGQPDQIVITGLNETMYFTEDGGYYAGVHGRDSTGQYFTILEGEEYTDEATGLSLSPDKMHMYIAFQRDGVLFDIKRTDGLPFDGSTVAVRYDRR